MMRWVVVGGCLTVAQFGLPAAQSTESAQAAPQTQATEQNQAVAPKQEQAQERYRYTLRNGEWWYWLPSGRWVYWRNNRWNDYNPRTFISPQVPPQALGLVSPNGGGSSSESRATGNSDIRPFYGHSLSTPDRRALEENTEIGPFYGHALPNEVFGPRRWRRSIRPYYGHAASADGD
jgi:hypothetical protein